MTSNLASDEIGTHGLELRKEAERISQQRRKGNLGNTYNIKHYSDR